MARINAQHVDNLGLMFFAVWLVDMVGWGRGDPGSLGWFAKLVFPPYHNACHAAASSDVQCLVPWPRAEAPENLGLEGRCHGIWEGLLVRLLGYIVLPLQTVCLGCQPGESSRSQGRILKLRFEAVVGAGTTGLVPWLT